MRSYSPAPKPMRCHIRSKASTWARGWRSAVDVGTSPAQSVWTSRADLGRAARARGLFLTTDDTAQAPELAELAQLRGLPAAPSPLRPAQREPAIWLAADEA